MQDEWLSLYTLFFSILDLFFFSIGFQLFALRNLFLSRFVSTCLFGGACIDTWNLMG